MKINIKSHIGALCWGNVSRGRLMMVAVTMLDVPCPTMMRGASPWLVMADDAPRRQQLAPRCAIVAQDWAL